MPTDLRLVVWNCCNALRGKLDALARLRPDVAIISECSKDDALGVGSGAAWEGRGRKGIAIITYGTYSVASAATGPEGSAYSLWADIAGPLHFGLLGLWTQAPGYVENAHAALLAHRDALSGRRAIVAGDLNSNVRFDPEHSPNHSDLVECLRDIYGMESAYHSHFGEAHGSETRPTHYHRYRQEAPYHIDYAFLPRTWLSLVRSVQVGSYDEWRPVPSDHTPLVVELSVPDEGLPPGT